MAERSFIGRELRSFRAYAKRNGLLLDRDKTGEFAWNDTRSAWEAWWTRALVEFQRATRGVTPCDAMRLADEYAAICNGLGNASGAGRVDLVPDLMRRKGAARAALVAHLSGVSEAPAWRTVAEHGLPKYQPDVTYIGINSAGYAACFNIADADGSCWSHTGEENICVMSGLRWWRVLDRPGIAGATEGE